MQFTNEAMGGRLFDRNMKRELQTVWRNEQKRYVPYSNIAHTNLIISPCLKYSLIVGILDTSCITMPEASNAQNSTPK